MTQGVYARLRVGVRVGAGGCNYSDSIDSTRQHKTTQDTVIHKRVFELFDGAVFQNNRISVHIRGVWLGFCFF